MAGRSNVGKSSLINAVLKRKSIARVSQTPGKTQAIQFYLINGQFHVVDLPGYGYAKVPKEMRRSWGNLVRSYLESSGELRLIFLLMDVRRIPNEDDVALHEWVKAAGIGEKIVLTKSDKVSKSELARSRTAIAGALGVGTDDLIPFSALTKKGIEDVRREIVTRL